MLRCSPKLLLLVLILSLPLWAQTTLNIPADTSWQSCGGCAGVGGVGPNTPRFLSVVSSPSLSGRALRFSISPRSAFSNALWWKVLGGNSATGIAYDFDVQMSNLGAPQALEFDVFDGTGGRLYLFGTECDVTGARQWRVWGNRRWNSTGLACALHAGFNHVTWEFSRAGGQVRFVAVTVNGAKHMINRNYAPTGTGGSFVHPTVQLDGNASRTAYAIYVDRMNLKYF
jgi:hypothetical protein